MAENYRAGTNYNNMYEPYCWYWSDIRLSNAVTASYCHDWEILGTPELWKTRLADLTGEPPDYGVQTNLTVSRKRMNAECMAADSAQTSLYSSIVAECNAGADNGVPVDVQVCVEYPQACPNIDFGDTSKSLLQKLQQHGAFCEYAPEPGIYSDRSPLKTKNNCWPWMLFDSKFPVNVSFSSTAFVSSAAGILTPNIDLGFLGLTELGVGSDTTALERRITAPGFLFQYFDPNIAAYKFMYSYVNYLSTSASSTDYQVDSSDLADFVYPSADYQQVYENANPSVTFTTYKADTIFSRIFFADQRNVSTAFDQRCFGPPKNNQACKTVWANSDLKQRGCAGYGRCPYTWDAVSKTATYCSGHGRCSMTGVCVCSYPYIGSMCQHNVATDSALDLLGDLTEPYALFTPVAHSFHKTYLEQLLRIDACSGHGTLRYEPISNAYGYIYCDCFSGWGGTTKHFKWDVSGSGGDVFFELNVYPTDLLLYASAVLSTPTSTVFANTPEWSGTGYTPATQLFFQQCAIWIPRILGQETPVTAQRYWTKYRYMTFDPLTGSVNLLGASLDQSVSGANVYASSQPTFMGYLEYQALQTAMSQTSTSNKLLPAFFQTPNWEWSSDYAPLVTDPTRWGNRTGTCVFGWTGLACDLKCPACNATHSRCVAKNDTIQLVNQGTYWDGERTSGYAVCECDYNWGGQNCSMQICPQTATQDHVCGGPARGVCVDNPANDTTATTLRRCLCFDGYHGSACELATPCPYNAQFGGVCSNPQPAVYENKTNPHGVCNNVTGKCDCIPTTLEDKIVGYTGTSCDLRACPFFNAQECSGAVQYDGGGSVCNRDDTTTIPTCDCRKTIAASRRVSSGPLTNWGLNVGSEARWGLACQHTYPEACNNPRTGLFCSGNAYACMPDNPADPYSKPKCRCNPKWSGEYCENSECPGGQHCVATAFNSSAGDCDDTTRCANGLCYEAPVVGHTGETLQCKCFGYNGAYYAGEACNDPAPECYAGDGVEGCHGPDHGECTRQGDGRYACLCKPWFNSPLCATQTDCLSCNKTGQMCQNFHNSTFTCGCDPRYYKTVLGGPSPVCQEICNATGGQPDAVINQCRCPPGSVWHDECSDVPAGVACHGSKFKGCRKLCPLYANKYECGLSSYTDSIKRCYYGGAPLINASSPEPAPNCTCEFSHSDPVRMPDSRLHYFVQASNGSCEPWCLNGNPLPFGNTCNCTSTRFSGTRCNQPACNGHGSIGADGTTCVCDSPWAYSPLDNCATDACAASGGYYPGTWNRKVDHCACHQGSSGVQYHNVSDPDNHLHQCKSLCDNGGVPDPATNKSTCTNCTGVYSGAFCDVHQCKHGSVPSANGLYCVCDRDKWPQFGGTYCNTSLCSHNTPAFATERGCNCSAVSPHLTGALCDVDWCTQPPSHGHLNLSISNTLCQCDIGYQRDSADANRCSRDVCNPGVPQACSGTACLHPDTMPGYNCNCGLHATRSANGGCYVPANTSTAGTIPCVNGVVLRNHTQLTTSCECYEGWAGVACNITACALENQVYDPDTDGCKCIFPFTGALCDQHTCGPHAGGPPICKQVIMNDTLVAQRHCTCNCTVGFRQRYYPFPSNQTFPCVLDCERPFSTLPLRPNATEAPTRFDAVGLVADNWYTDANISTTQCPCAGNFTGALCTGNPKYPERDTNTTKWINDLLENHKEKWPAWKYVLVSMITAIAAAAIAYSIYKIIEDRRTHSKYQPVPTTSGGPSSYRLTNLVRGGKQTIGSSA